MKQPAASLVDVCPHANVFAEVCDQTLGVACSDCHVLLAWCWEDHHVSEALWNRACALCAEPIVGASS